MFSAFGRAARVLHDEFTKEADMRSSFAFWQLLFSLGLAAGGCASSDDSGTSGTFDGSCTTVFGGSTFCWEDYNNRRAWMIQQCAQAPTSSTNICVSTASLCQDTIGGTAATCTGSFLCDDPATPVCCAITNTLGSPGSSATYSTDHCSTSGLSGKCTTLSGTVQFYYGGNAAVSQDSCTSSGGTWSKS
jgi:hypothetical protein